MLSRIGNWNFLGVDSDTEDVKLHKSLLVLSAFTTSFAGISWSLIYFNFNEWIPGLLPLAYGIACYVILTIYMLKPHLYSQLFIFQRIIILLIPFLLFLSLGGFANSSAVIMWGLIAPFTTTLLPDDAKDKQWFLAYLVLLIIGTLAQPLLRESNNLPDDIVLLFFSLNILGMALITFLLFQYFVGKRDTIRSLLDQEKNRSEKLLLNVLPMSVAQELKDGESKAKIFNSVTILFADIVGFTKLSSEINPEIMLSLLNDIFSAFDEMAIKYNVEKIRTIGDSYMVAGGALMPRNDHAKVICSLALDMMNFLQTFHNKTELTNQINFRMGINTGTVIGGIIGTTKFHYDLWGDAVNIASRMESHSISGKIQITENTYELIKDKFSCEVRGIIDIKGKGVMKTYFLTGLIL